MRVVAYSIKSSEKEPLAVANHKKHEITLISNKLTVKTASFAVGKDAVIVTVADQLDADVINMLADIGVKYIATRSTSADHIDVLASGIRHMKIGSVPRLLIEEANLEEIDEIYARQTILNLDNWEGKACLGKACVCAKSCGNMDKDVTKTPLTSEHGN
jgi:hypothetical protein